MTDETFNNAKSLFGIPEDIIYLNCASLSPQLKSVTKAGEDALQRKVHPWKIKSADWFEDPETLRALAAKVINADTEGMALVSSVSYGISIAANNLPINKGQEIIVLDEEYPSNYYAWKEIAKLSGANVITVYKGEQTWTDAILAAINDKTTVISVPLCHWTNGSLVDLERVSKKVKEVGAALVIDASQSMGAYPIDVNIIQPDFLVAVGYKWLLGPYGLGYLYAAPKWRTEGRPIEYSWLTKMNSEDFAGLVKYRDDFRPGARRFDMGGFPGFIHVPMAIAALKQVLAWDVNHIQSQLSLMTQQIAAEAAKLNFTFPKQDERVGHMIGINFEGEIPNGLKESLQKENIFVAFRGNSIRIAPHLYTKGEDIERLFNILGRQW